jgi:UDP-N-acetylmuramoyl-L-alanyl-D-glutamate--2,6-diaminopimelate ligase
VSAYDRIRQALLERGRLIEAPEEPLPDILGVTEDSRRVRSGWLFCAIDGTNEDGHAYVPEAASRGAAAAIVTQRQDIALPQLVVDDSRAATSIAAAEWFGWPADKLAVIGVTGTNGKSTTVALIRHLLNRDADVASVGTLGAFDGQGAPLYEEGLTTPGSVQLQEILAGLRDRGAKRVVMEVSSHALSQCRVDCVGFAAGVYTNLTHDHLDYHSSFDDYIHAKSQLAEKIRPGGALVVNTD